MAQLGLGLGAQINGSNTFDPDALRYFTTAGVTDATGKSQINTFVRGIKSLGLYNNMVAWPLRSTQNAGTGVTAYSLGGFGVYNGTLTNGPTWGTGGVTFDGTDDLISTALTTGFPDSVSAFAIATCNSASAGGISFSKDNLVANNRAFLILYGSSKIVGFSTGGSPPVFNYINNTSVSPITYAVGVPSCASLRHGSAFKRFRRNNEAGTQTDVAGSTFVQGSAAVRIGNNTGTTDIFNGTIHAAILFNTALTDAQTSAVYALYQTSLGAGLGLPDADASAYIARAGVTDATGQQQINDFVVGVKNLGLYNNMVAWPLRSTQNAGTGVTAYSLGNLGTYDGTLTNGPTWGTGGITLDGVDDYIETAFTTGLSEFSAFSVTTSNSTGLRFEYSKDNTTTTREFAVWQTTLSATNWFVKISSGLIQAAGGAYTTDCKLHCLRASESLNKLRRNNGSDVTATAGILTQGNMQLRLGASGAGAGVYFFGGSISSMILFNKALTDSETSSMYTLYSTTLGSGLGLP